MDYNFDDFVRTFRIRSANVRGRHVKLQHSLQLILDQHKYPDIISQQLGQLIALAVLLASTIKYEGTFTVQTNSTGPLRMMVVDVTSTHEIRGYADFDSNELKTILIEHCEPPIPLLMGSGQLAFTVNQSLDKELYQGIVPIEGISLSDCAHNYFRQSEQISTAIKLSSGKNEGVWSCAAIMLQRDPTSQGISNLDDSKPTPTNYPPHMIDSLNIENDENWRTCVSLMSTVKDSELLSLIVTSDQLLYNLFHEVSVIAYPECAIHFKCRCSRGRVKTTLNALPKNEIEALATEGQLIVTCKFCNKDETFEKSELATLYAT